MTGDGINDIVAMKKSDCSIALEKGAPATKNISNLILLDSNFANLKEAVYQGRRVVNNVKRSATLFIMKDVCWFLMSIFPVLFSMPHSLEATVMSATNIFITGIGSFMLSIEPDKSEIQGNFLKDTLSRSIVAGVFMFLPIFFGYIWSFIKCGLDPTLISEYMANNLYPVLSICLTVCSFIIFFNICCPFTKYRRILFIILALAVAIVICAFPGFFLKNGTDYMKELLATYDDLWGLIMGILSNVFKFDFIKSFGVDSWIFVGVFIPLSAIIYIVTDKLVGKLLNKTLFNNNKF